MAVAEVGDAGRNVDDAKAAQKIGNFSLVSYDLRYVRQLRQLVRGARGVTAHDDDAGVRVFASEPADSLPALAVALGRDRAGVHDAQVSRLVVFGIPISRAQESLTNQLGFVLVDFAAEGKRAE